MFEAVKTIITEVKAINPLTPQRVFFKDQDEYFEAWLVMMNQLSLADAWFTGTGLWCQPISMHFKLIQIAHIWQMGEKIE